MSDILLSFYGDDFTGSTDALESLVLGGLRTALFLEPPTADQLQGRFAGLQAIGVAGVSRSMSPAQMDEQLLPAFIALKRLNTPLFHYKVCSTFDSSPTIGSIGHAIDLGWPLFDPEFVPLVIGAPMLNRFVVFGNLFARVEQTAYRLDRHPTMSKHPVTPMNESDLRRHLGQQTTRTIGLIDVLQLVESDAKIEARLGSLIEAGTQIVLFDTLDPAHLTKVGRLLWARRGTKSVFIVGSSGVEVALTLHLQAEGIIQKAQPLPTLQPVKQLIVMSGSASPITAAQIQHAIGHGFVGIRLDVVSLIKPDTATEARERLIAEACDALNSGKSIVIYSATGPDDPAITAARAIYSTHDNTFSGLGAQLGSQQGLILRALLEQSEVNRICVAGGDTSGNVAAQLGIYALEMISPIDPGAPLCRASSHHSRFDGLQVTFKGGQNGTPDYFVRMLRGST